MARRKKFEIERENHDRWLISYADFITLLFAFFVVMYAMSSVNQGKYKVLTTSLGTAFGKEQEGDGTGSQQAAEATHGPSTEAKKKGYSFIKPFAELRPRTPKWQREREAMIAQAMQFANTLSPLVNAGKVQVVQNNRGIRIDIASQLLFEQGSADVQASAFETLQEIANLLNTHQHYLQVEGHTDNVPIHSAQFYSNWELSALRASSVLRMLAQFGVSEARMGAVGYGDVQPIASNDTPEGQSRNRRVSIMVLYDAPQAANEGAAISPSQAIAVPQ